MHRQNVAKHFSKDELWSVGGSSSTAEGTLRPRFHGVVMGMSKLIRLVLDAYMLDGHSQSENISLPPTCFHRQAQGIIAYKITTTGCLRHGDGQQLEEKRKMKFWLIYLTGSEQCLYSIQKKKRSWLILKMCSRIRIFWGKNRHFYYILLQSDLTTSITIACFYRHQPNVHSVCTMRTHMCHVVVYLHVGVSVFV